MQNNDHHGIDNKFARDEAVAADTSTDPAVLDAIARKPVDRGTSDQRLSRNVGYARENVARNPSALPETLEWLSQLTSDYMVIAGVMENPNTPLDVLWSAANHAESHIASLIVQNPGCGDAFILRVVDLHAGNLDVALRALRNPSITNETFELIAASVESRWDIVVDELRSARHDRE